MRRLRGFSCNWVASGPIGSYHFGRFERSSWLASVLLTNRTMHRLPATPRIAIAVLLGAIAINAHAWHLHGTSTGDELAGVGYCGVGCCPADSQLKTQSTGDSGLDGDRGLAVALSADECLACDLLALLASGYASATGDVVRSDAVTYRRATRPSGVVVACTGRAYSRGPPLAA